MRLNISCIRKILLYVEKHNVFETVGNKTKLHEVSYYELSNADYLKNYSTDDIWYSAIKLFEGNYVNGYFIPSENINKMTRAYVETISMSGHELLDNIREEPIWTETKKKLGSIASVSLSVFSQVAGETAAAYSKRMTGLQ